MKESRFKEEKDSLLKEIQRIKATIKSLEGEQVSEQTKKLSDMQNEQDKLLVKKKVDIQNITNESKQIEKERDNQQRKLAEYESRIKRNQDKIKEIEKETLENSQVELNGKKEQIREMEIVLKQIQEGKQVQNLQEGIEKQIDSLKQNEKNLVQKRGNMDKQMDLNSKTIQDLQKQIKMMEQDSKDYSVRVSEIQNEIGKLQSLMVEKSGVEKQMRELEQDKQQLRDKIMQDEHQLQNYQQFANMYKFYFKMPLNATFKSSEVKGKIIELFEVQDLKKYGIALENVA